MTPKEDDVSADIAAAYESSESSAPEAPVEQQEEFQPVEPIQDWSEEFRGEWGKFNPRHQNLFASEYKNALGKWDKERSGYENDRKMASAIREASNPYMAMLQAENTTPEKAFGSLLQSAWILRHGSPQQKSALVQKLVTDYNINLAAQPESQIDPALQTLVNEINGLKQSMAQNQTRYQTEQENAKRQQFTAIYDSFLKNKKDYPFFADVEQDMVGAVAAIMRSEPSLPTEEVLKKAYSKAVYMNDAVREKLMKPAPGKTSVRGSPNGAAKLDTKDNDPEDIYEALSRNWDRATAIRA